MLYCTMDKFEYKVALISGQASMLGGSKSINTPKMTDMLNKYGNDGWELIASKASEQGWGLDKGILCIFKRQRTSKSTTSSPSHTANSQTQVFSVEGLSELKRQNLLLTEQIKLLDQIRETIGSPNRFYGNQSIVCLLEHIWEKMH